MYIDIAGIPQYIQIEMDASQNPILLLVHGGPGASTRFASSAWQCWRHYFTLVHWDQRGAGNTFAKNGPENSGPMTFDQIVLDGVSVAEFLCSHMGHRRIFLLGHSWGSAVAVHMVKLRPDLFAAFMGTGLLVDFEQNERANYQRQIKQAQHSDNREAITVLSEIGPPPYDDINSIRTLRKLADELADGTGDAPFPVVTLPAEFSPEDREFLSQGFAFSSEALFSDLCNIDLPSLGTGFDVPMFCLMGTHDQQTPIEVAERYFDTIKAPYKDFIRFEGCHHFVHINRPEDFLEAMVRDVLHKVPEVWL